VCVCVCVCVCGASTRFRVMAFLTGSEISLIGHATLARTPLDE
jgi:hypothetical protein